MLSQCDSRKGTPLCTPYIIFESPQGIPKFQNLWIKTAPIQIYDHLYYVGPPTNSAENSICSPSTTRQ